MGAKVETGYIVLADISGFEAYMTSVELDHAHGVIGDLLQRLIDGLIPPLHLAGVEGDAVLAYLPKASASRGETLLELIEAAYSDFANYRQDVYRNTTCRCKACLSIPSLNLKFLVHYGEYLIQPDPSGATLIGSAVQMIRDRLLKDQVSGKSAYALFTVVCLEHLEIQPEGMQLSERSYPHYGEIRTVILDLQSRHQATLDSRRALVTPDEADLRLTCDLDAHGKDVLEETVIDWRPFEYFTVETRHLSGMYSLMQTYRLRSLQDGDATQLDVFTSIRKPKGLMRWWLKRRINRLFQADYARLGKLMASDRGS